MIGFAALRTLFKLLIRAQLDRKGTMTSTLGFPHAQVLFSMTGHVEPVAPCFAVSLSYSFVCVCVWPVQALSTG